MKTYRVNVKTTKYSYVDVVCADCEDIYDELPSALYLDGIIDSKSDDFDVIDYEDISDQCFLED